jgi:hypothetical protein
MEDVGIVMNNFSDYFRALRSDSDRVFPMPPQDIRNEIYETKPRRRWKLRPEYARRIFGTFTEFGITNATILGLSLGNHPSTV